MPRLNAALVPAPYQVVIRLTGDADLSTARLATDVLSRAGDHGTPRVIVDLAGARLRDVSLLHALVAFTATLATEGRSCRIVGAQHATRRLVSLAQLADRLHVDGPSPGGRLPVARTDEPAAVRRPVCDHPVPVRGLHSARVAGPTRLA